MNFDRSLWNLKCRVTEEGGPNVSLPKEIVGGITVMLILKKRPRFNSW